MKKNFTLILLFCVYVLSAQVTLVPYGSPWKYLDDGTNQGTAWYGTGFNDASWASGNSELGYGDGDEATVISYGPSSSNKYCTSYFRQTFSVSSVSSYTAYTISLKRDDGIIVYVNGAEVYRNNMPASGVTYTTYASTNCADDGGTFWTATLPASVIVTGTNVIAAEVHQTNASSSDLTFQFQLVGNTNFVIPTIVKGPYLQVGTQNSMIVRWETNVATDSQVMFGTNAASLVSSVTNTASSVTHVMQLSGLSPYTKYYYSIGSSTLVAQGDTNNYFMTSPVPGTPGKYRFWVTGDCGNASTNQTNCKNQYKLYNGNGVTNGWLLLGDNAYSSGTNSEFTSKFFNVYQTDVMKSMPLWPTPGNHDYNNGASTATTVPYFSIFSTPVNAEAGGVASGNPAYYSYDYGNVHFLSLDSYGRVGSDKMYDTTGAQAVWVKQDLAANTKKWTIAYWHHPPYTMGSHNSDTESDLVNIRQRFIKILERNGVDMIMCGHSHDYERSKLMNGHYGNEASFNAATHHLSSSSANYDGTTDSCPYTKDSTGNKIGTVYVLSGSAGQLGGQQGNFPHNAMHYSNASNGGSFIIDIEDNKLEGKWLCADGIVRDKFTIFKDVKATKVYTVQSGQATMLSASWPGSYVWSNSSTSRTLTVNPMSDATFWVKDPNNCVTDTFKFKVLPATSFTLTTPFCAAKAVQFTDLSSNNANGWAWSVNPSSGVTATSFTAQNPGITFPGAGIYTVSLISDNAYGSGTAFSQTVTINSNPSVLSTISSTAVCLNQSATLTTSGAASYSWSTGSTATSIAVNPTTTTAYTVTGTDMNGCETMDVKTLVVNPLPVVTATSTALNGIVCAGNTLALNGMGAVSYAWSSGLINAVTFTPASSSVYTVTGTDGNGCQGVAQYSVTVNPLPVLATTANPTNAVVCDGSTLTLNATGATSYVWSGGITNGVAFTPAASGNYTVTGTLNGCQSSTTRSVTVNPNPTVMVTGANAICAGQTATLTAGGANLYVWNTSATTAIIAISPAANTSYTVTGTNSNGCSGSAIKSITVNPLPLLSVIAPSVSCSGLSLNLAASGASTYTWNTGATGASLSVNPTVTTTYSITGSDANGCLGSASHVITVHPLPTITVNSGAVCPGYSFVITPSGASTYTYSGGSNIVSPLATTNYSVTGTSAQGCVSSVAAVATVSVVNTLTVTISGASVVCSGQPVSLTAGGASTYTWSTGAMTSVLSQTPASNTTYSVTGGSASCTNTAVFSVIVNPLPVISVSSNNTLICVGESADLQAGGANTYAWSNAQNGSLISVSPSVSTTYTVTGTSLDGCLKTATITQQVNECLGVRSLATVNGKTKVYPNPNKGIFNVDLNFPGNISIEVYNTLGELVYSSKLSQGSNSVSLDVNRGIYFYNILNDKKVKESGKLIVE